MKTSTLETSTANLDAIFGSLADPTRRMILSKLAAGDATVSEIAAPFSMSQPAISKHLKVLENAGLIKRTADRQTRPAQLNAAPLASAVKWLEEFREFWSGSFDQLDSLLLDLQLTKGNEDDRSGSF